MFHFSRRIRTSDLISVRWLGICLLCLAALFALGAKPAFAQTLNRREIHRLLIQRRLEAAALNIKIRHEQVQLARLQTVAFPSLAVALRIATLQASVNQNLNTIQTLNNQIVLHDQLLALINEAAVVSRKIQIQERRIGELQRLGNGTVVQQRIANLQTNIQNLQTVLAAIQQQINQVQSQIIL